MTTLTLRPDGAGDETNIQTQYPDSGFHWDKVDEVVADDASSFLYNGAIFGDGSWKRDLYNLPASGGVGTITGITVYVRCYTITGAGQAAALKVVMKTGGTVYEGDAEDITNSWEDYSKEWTTNLQTSSAWTWSDIDSLQIGASTTWIAGAGQVTQVYVVVTYTDATYGGISLSAQHELGTKVKTSVNTYYRHHWVRGKPSGSPLPELVHPRPGIGIPKDMEH